MSLLCVWAVQSSSRLAFDVHLLLQHDNDWISRWLALNDIQIRECHETECQQSSADPGN